MGEEYNLEDYEWKLTIEPGRKGGPGSGHWGHAGRPGKVGGSVSGSVAMSIRTGRTARERQAAARGTIPGHFKTLEQAKVWFTKQGLEADFTGITNVDAVNEIASEIDRLRGEFGWAFEAHKVIADTDWPKRMSETKDWKFLGVKTYQSEGTPGKVVGLGGDAAAMTEDRSVLVRDHGGPVIYWNPDTVNANQTSLLAEIGWTSAPTKNLGGVTSHEMGHVIWSVVAQRPKFPYTMTPDEPAYMRFGSEFGYAMNRVGITQRMLKRNVSYYATHNDKEAFAEIFAVMQHPEGTNMSKAFRKRLDKLSAELEQVTGLEVLKWSSQ